jgi:hypothetical protein
MAAGVFISLSTSHQACATAIIVGDAFYGDFTIDPSVPTQMGDSASGLHAFPPLGNISLHVNGQDIGGVDFIEPIEGVGSIPGFWDMEGGNVFRTDASRTSTEIVVIGSPDPLNPILPALVPPDATRLKLFEHFGGSEADAFMTSFTSDGLSDYHFSGTISVIYSVPEPSTWATLLIGFAGIGCAAYRKRSAPPFIQYTLIEREVI